MARRNAAPDSGSNDEAESADQGKLDFIQGDFFKRDWQSVALSGSTGFDLVYDYTVRTKTPLATGP